MAEPRKSSKSVAARQRARARAAEFRAVQDRLEELATSYFIAQDEKDEISESVAREIAQVHARAEVRLAEVERAAADAIAAMLELGVKRPEIASRLGISTRDVKRPESETSAQSEVVPATEPELGE